jgi:hypothetical protein
VLPVAEISVALVKLAYGPSFPTALGSPSPPAR